MNRVDIKQPSGVHIVLPKNVVKAMIDVKGDVQEALFEVWSKLQDDLPTTTLIDKIKKRQAKGRA